MFRKVNKYMRTIMLTTTIQKTKNPLNIRLLQGEFVLEAGLEPARP